MKIILCCSFRETRQRVTESPASYSVFTTFRTAITFPLFTHWMR